MKTPQLIIDFLNPRFIKRLDRYLLLNYPRIWISKIHYVFYYGVWANIILNFLVFIFFSESSQSHLIDEFIQFIILVVMLIEVAAFVYWFLKQCLFNIEKEYGNYSFTDGIMEIIIYTMCTIIIISSSLTMTATAIHRVANNDRDTIITHQTDCGLDTFFLLDRLEYLNRKGFLDTDKFERLRKDIETKNSLKWVRQSEYLKQLELSNTDKFERLIKDVKAKNSLSIKWQSKFSYQGEESYESLAICQDIQEFITNDIYESSSQLPYDIHWWFHTIFAILGIFFLIIRKHSNWRIIGWIIFYIIISTILSIFLGVFLSSSNSNFFAFIDAIFFHIDLSDSGLQILVGFVFLIVLFMIITSIQLLKKRKYAQFLYINFLSLPIAVGVLIFSLYLAPSNGATEHTWILIKFFAVYSCFVPLQKKILNHVLSLPKE
ncbi:MAG: hypothetical protein F6K54_04660 [Okeania sp. SIO3B5]|uniref:hypothetical protein n=1 Tax=Okeania sp. SIO3B5 TaxID=2607811 RepID=UPI0013FEC208|nr:hypothetical protein [Okeania sp. SIO3B5]NEO52430.1 hypothetical protein [Okeania sp. SIO3B5]